MKLQFKVSDIHAAVKYAADVAEKKQALPILTHILVYVAGGVAAFTGTDLEVEVKAAGKIDGVNHGSFTLPAKKTSDILRALPGNAVVNLETDEKELKAVIKSGRSRFSVSSLPSTDFPSMGDAIERDANRFEIDGGVLRKALEHVHFAMGNQDVRYYLNGMLLEAEAQCLKCVATDGHRLAMYTMKEEIQGLAPFAVVLPRRAIALLLRTLVSDKVRVSIGRNIAMFEMGSLTVTTKLIDGRFPDYTRVVPKGGSTVMVNLGEFVGAVNRVALLSSEKYRGVRIEVSPSAVALHANNPEQESAEDEVQASFDGERPIALGMNVQYLQEALAVISTEAVRVMLGGSDTASVVKNDEDDSSYQCVIMPMRL